MDKRHHKGLTFIEMAIAIAAVAVLLALALPGFQGQDIRARVAAGIDVASTAQAALADTCASNPRSVVHPGDTGDFAIPPSEFVDSLTAYANCERGTLAVELVMRNTGAETSPVVALFGVRNAASGDVSWECRTIMGDASHVPSTCREAGIPDGFAPYSLQSI